MQKRLTLGKGLVKLAKTAMSAVKDVMVTDTAALRMVAVSRDAVDSRRSVKRHDVIRCSMPPTPTPAHENSTSSQR